MAFAKEVPKEVSQQVERIKEKLLIPLTKYVITKEEVKIAAIIKEVVEDLIRTKGIHVDTVNISSVIQEALKSIIHKEKIVTYEPDIKRLDIADIIKNTLDGLIKENAVKVTPVEVKDVIVKKDPLDVAKVVKDAMDQLIVNGEVKIQPQIKYNTKEENTIKYIPVDKEYSVAETVERVLKELIEKSRITVPKPKFIDETIQVMELEFQCPHCKQKFSLGGRKKNG